MNHKNNYWGSSMSDQHPDVKRSGQVHVTVPTVNIIQLIAENTIPGDQVTVKMDIEGAEWDILPCLADSPAAGLIDQLLVEYHPINLGAVGTSEDEMQSAVARLKSKGVHVPQYSSPAELQRGLHTAIHSDPALGAICAELGALALVCNIALAGECWQTAPFKNYWSAPEPKPQP